MSDVISLKRGDLEPPLEILCTDDEVPVDLSLAASIRVIGARSGIKVIDQSASGSSAGVVLYNWQAGDTDLEGVIDLEVEVTWAGNRKQTFPANSYLSVRIIPDLG